MLTLTPGRQNFDACIKKSDATQPMCFTASVPEVPDHVLPLPRDLPVRAVRFLTPRVEFCASRFRASVPEVPQHVQRESLYPPLDFPAAKKSGRELLILVCREDLLNPGTG